MDDNIFKVVLILRPFTEERKAVLDTLHSNFRTRIYLPYLT
jgi:hypothetical protein